MLKKILAALVLLAIAAIGVWVFIQTGFDPKIMGIAFTSAIVNVAVALKARKAS